jgi:hypothetical protein
MALHLTPKMYSIANEEINLIENVYFILANSVIHAYGTFTRTRVGPTNNLRSKALVRRNDLDIAHRKTTGGAIVVILISHRRAYMWRIR